MIRNALIVLAAFLIVLAAFFLRQPHGTIDYQSFEPRLRSALQSSGFRIEQEASCGGDQVPLPLRLRSSEEHHDSGFSAIVGFPNSAVHYQLTATGSRPLDCFARYLDGRAAAIAIHARAAEEPLAHALRSALTLEFPDLFITLTLDDA